MTSAMRKLTCAGEARCGIIRQMPVSDGIGKIVLETGETSDTPVAEEGALI